jgi:hypothetical protein
MTVPCVFCLANGELDERQVLLRGTHLYICAPRGQLVEGCLIAAPYECIGCFAHAPASHLEELAVMQALIEGFYRDAYGVERATFYEQGRAGAGAAIDSAGGFPHHAHLCSLPLVVDLHGVVAREYAAVHVTNVDDSAHVSSGRPYLYVEAAGTRAVYLARSAEGARSLEQLRLKPRIAELLGLGDRGDWRAYPGDEALERVIDRFREHLVADGVI